MTMTCNDQTDVTVPSCLAVEDTLIQPRDAGREFRFQASSPVTCSLSSSLEFNNGDTVLVRNNGTANITVLASVDELIDGAASVILEPEEFRWLQTDGYRWSSISRYSDEANQNDAVSVSANDTAPGDLETKLLAGAGLNATTQNDGAAETRTLAVDAGTGPNQIVQLDASSRLPAVDGSQLTGLSDLDESVKVSANDTTPGDLEGKLIAGTGLNATTQNDGANETRTLAVNAGAGPNQIVQLDASSRLPAVDGSQLTGLSDLDENVKVSANDTAPGNLEGKLIAGTGLNASTQNEGAAETRTLAVDVGVSANQIVQLDGQAAMPDVAPGNFVRRDQTTDLQVGYGMAVHALGTIASGSVTPAFASAPLQTMTIGGSFTLNEPASGSGRLMIEAVNDATGGYTVTLAVGYQSLGGTYDASANAVNLFEITKVGANSYITIVQTV